MGVDGLWRLLDVVSRPVNLSDLEGRVLAVDISIWLHQIVRAMRTEDGSLVHNAHIIAMLSRLSRLMHHRIKPVFVFDGGAPPIKRQTMQNRKRREEEGERELRNRQQQLLLNQLKQHLVDAIDAGKLATSTHSENTTTKDARDAKAGTTATTTTSTSTTSTKASTTNIEATTALTIDGSDTDVDDDDDWNGDQDESLVEEGTTMYININRKDSIFTPAFDKLASEEKYRVMMDARENFRHKKKNSKSSIRHKPSSDKFSTNQLENLRKRNQMNQRLEEVRQELLDHTWMVCEH
eukprot:m.14293 g.14293  ORF g.14293 m.14293 type:complete len:294 (+) comp7712_c0_seq1:45-926(+)